MKLIAGTTSMQTHTITIAVLKVCNLSENSIKKKSQSNATYLPDPGTALDVSVPSSARKGTGDQQLGMTERKDVRGNCSPQLHLEHCLLCDLLSCDPVKRQQQRTAVKYRRMEIQSWAQQSCYNPKRVLLHFKFYENYSQTRASDL